MTKPVSVAGMRESSMQMLLGSVLAEPLVVEGREVPSTSFADANTAASLRIHLLVERLKLPAIVEEEAYNLWRRSVKVQGRGHHVALYLVYIAARVHGREVKVEDLIRFNKKLTNIAKFVNAAGKLAAELGVAMPRRDHDRVLLRMVDELQIDRSILAKAKGLYPKARLIRGGDPRVTMGALIWLLTRDGSPITHGSIALSLGLSEYTIRKTSEILRDGGVLDEATRTERLATEAEHSRVEMSRLIDRKPTRSKMPVYSRRADHRPETQEMRRMAADLLDVGLKVRTVALVLGDLHPEKTRRSLSLLASWQDRKRR